MSKNCRLHLSIYTFFTMAETPLKINLKRKPNWSEEELQMMASGIRENREILFGKFSPSVTSEKRRAVWNEITKQVNAVSLNCGTREVEDVKKRWKDAKTAVKKKESKRKSGIQKTGGGPPVDVTFRPWELDVLSLIPEETISGLEGAIDTSINKNVSESTLSTYPDGVENPFIIEEVEIPEETELSEPSTSSANESKESGRKGDRRTTNKRKNEPEDPWMAELLAIKRQRVEVEVRKAVALERIASALEFKKQ
uniref:Uncharacterized protein LOC111108680 n=1 Tax=Crassostrea virginica TaxID=6565 RepID=A0A8B8BAH2_CRAVI|nr:uncharacterized protein LOC111108680 [Crassostrea virginica]